MSNESTPQPTTQPAEPTTGRVAYDEPTTPHDMYADARLVGAKLRYDRIARAASAPAPSISYDDFPTDLRKREISVDEAANRVAAAIFGA